MGTRKIGIGITTRNRRQCLELALTHHMAYRPEGARIIVVDDDSNEYNADRNRELASYLADDYVRTPSRSGVAAAKNLCLRQLSGSDFYFLFDDDAFPADPRWADSFIHSCEESGCQHSVWQDTPHQRTGSDRIFHHNDWPMGVCLFYSAKAIEQVPEMDPGFGTFGYEHVDHSLRIHAAGLMANRPPFVSPIASNSLIYSLDLHWLQDRIPPPIGQAIHNFTTSVPLSSRSSELDEAYNYFESRHGYMRMAQRPK